MTKRSNYNDPPLVTELQWRPHAHRPGNQRGALVGTLWGVPVTGIDTGRGTAYQFGLLTGEVRTVWWDGTMWTDTPNLFDVDTGEQVLRNPTAVAWFTRLDQQPEGEAHS